MLPGTVAVTDLPALTADRSNVSTPRLCRSTSAVIENEIVRARTTAQVLDIGEASTDPGYSA